MVLDENPAISLVAPNSPCSLEGAVHYSFDYAQQIHFPSKPRENVAYLVCVVRPCPVILII